MVVDPHRTVAAGKVEIGAFRTFPEVGGQGGQGGWQECGRQECGGVRAEQGEGRQCRQEGQVGEQGGQVFLLICMYLVCLPAGA